MKFGKFLLLGCAVVAMTTAAAAFQEQQGSGGQAAKQEAAPVQADKPLAGFATTDAGGKSDAGTEVRIPGLGKLGVLPKMDFGLELLYGAAGETRATEPRPDTGADDDLRIRGTVKHRF